MDLFGPCSRSLAPFSVLTSKSLLLFGVLRRFGGRFKVLGSLAEGMGPRCWTPCLRGLGCRACGSRLGISGILPRVRLQGCCFKALGSRAELPQPAHRRCCRCAVNIDPWRNLQETRFVSGWLFWGQELRVWLRFKTLRLCGLGQGWAFEAVKVDVH